MHCIAKQRGFIIANPVQQIFVPLDKAGLLVRVQLARHCFRLAMCSMPSRCSSAIRPERLS
jgi:hypothetical protein